MMPKGYPDFVSGSVGKSPAEKLSIIETAIFSLCQHIEERGYSFEDGADAPSVFFSEDEKAAEVASNLIRFMLGVIWAEEIVKGRGHLVPVDVPAGFDPSRN